MILLNLTPMLILAALDLELSLSPRLDALLLYTHLFQALEL